MRQEIIEQIKRIVPDTRVIENESMQKHITFRAGGITPLFVELVTQEEIMDVVSLLEKETEDYYLIGNGSNLLVSDKGYQGAVLHISKDYNEIRVEENKLICKSGASLAMIAREALEHGLTGFEFAAGIPGSLGGAIVMNAGAYGGEMAQVVESVTLFSAACGKVTKRTEEMHFGYRHSILKEENWTVLEVVISLEPGDRKKIREKMDQLAKQRIEKQPLEYPSAGSTFKRPEGYFAGKLIQDAGLRGYTVGGAQVSEKHCGFVINKNHATATDIYRLIMDVQEKVKHDTGVMLEPEVILLGDFQT